MPRKKKDSETNIVSEPTLALYNTKEFIADEKKPSIVEKGDKEDVLSEAFSKSRFLANSIAFYSFLLKEKNSDEKILSFIYLSLITASELRIYNNNLEEFYSNFNKNVNSHFNENTDDYKNWGIAFFIYLISENPQKYGIIKKPINEFSDIQKAVELINEVRKGKRSTNAMLEFIESFSEEQNVITEIKKFVQDIQKDDPFLNLPKINDSIFKIVGKEPLIDKRLKYRVQIIKALGHVLENSTKDPKDIVLNFLSNKDKEMSEIDIHLFALFLIRLFYGNPYEKTIPLSFLDKNSMNYIAPLSEVFINPKPIIEGAKKSKMKIEEYFWAYVRNNPKSIFEDIKVEEIEIIKKVKRKHLGNIISFDIEVY